MLRLPWVLYTSSMSRETKVTIYHNPACGTSRNTLALLEEHEIPHGVIKYLDAGLTRRDYESFLDMIPDEPTALVRRDKRFKELGISESEVQTRAQVLQTLEQHPELMQRPILVKDGKAIISRPAEKAIEFLKL